MRTITFDSPAPSCLVPITHPARPAVHSTETDIRDTLDRHTLVFNRPIQDDYELTDALGYLERLGEFK